MTVLESRLKLTKIQTSYLVEDKGLFVSKANEIIDLLNGVHGDFEMEVINAREISIKNETACPCFNQFKADGCSLVEELINNILNDYNRRFSAKFIQCSKSGSNCCELLMKFD